VWLRGYDDFGRDQVLHSPGFQVDVIDTSVAGDSFGAGFSHAHVVRGMPLVTALRFASTCGVPSTTGCGGVAAQPALQQVQDLLRSFALPSSNSRYGVCSNDVTTHLVPAGSQSGGLQATR
jgi:hypothetical protein